MKRIEEYAVPPCATCIAYVRRIADGAVAAAERDGTIATTEIE